jgi:hypothetical protein
MIIVDRIEGKVAVCETDSGMLNISLKLIKGKVRDGVVLVERDGAYRVDEQATKKREEDTNNSSQGIWRE